MKTAPYKIGVKVLLDSCAFLAAWLVSFMIRFPADTIQQLNPIIPFIPLFIAIQLISFAIFRQYTAMWRYSDLHVLEGILKATTLGTVAIVSMTFFIKIGGMPRSIVLINWLLIIFFSGGIRFLVRRVYTIDHRPLKKGDSYRRVLIYGAGKGGELLLRNIENTRQAGINVIGFIDNKAENTVIIGAHFDHLGFGGEGSLYRDSIKAILCLLFSALSDSLNTGTTTVS